MNKVFKLQIVNIVILSSIYPAPVIDMLSFEASLFDSSRDLITGEEKWIKD